MFQPDVASWRPCAPQHAKASESWNRLRMPPTSSSPCFSCALCGTGCIEDHFQARALLDVSSENFLHNAPWAGWKFPQRHSRGLAQPRIEYIVTPGEQDPYPRGCHLTESSNIDIKSWAERACYFWSAGCIYPRKCVRGGDFSTIMKSKTGTVTAPPLNHGSLVLQC